MRVNQATIDLIKHFEGLRLEAYRDPVGITTIGYGHTALAGPPTPRKGMTISEAEAEAILTRDVEKVAQRVREMVGVPLTDNQFGALVSLGFNIGTTKLRTSTAIRNVNDRNFDEVPERIKLWNRAGGKILAGLVRRREEEVALWLSVA